MRKQRIELKSMKPSPLHRPIMEFLKESLKASANRPTASRQFMPPQSASFSVAGAGMAEELLSRIRRRGRRRSI
jgi:hypothetical protein